MTSIASWLLAARTDRALSQADLAAEVGVSQATISTWERGKHEPSPEQLQALQAVLGTKPSAKAQTPEPAPRTSKKRARKAARRAPMDEPTSPTKTAKAKAAKSKGSGKGKQGSNDELWAKAYAFHGSMDAAAYKPVVLGLIFLKYISDAFEALHRELADDPNSDPEDRDEYSAKRIFWVPPAARWSALQEQAKNPAIGCLLDDAMEAIERENLSLKGTLPKEYAAQHLDKRALGQLIDLIGTAALVNGSDFLPALYEDFLGRFAGAEGKDAGRDYTPRSIVRTLVEMLEPRGGRVYDPACGSGGMLVQTECFVRRSGGNPSDLSIYGQEQNATTWRLCKMNLALRRIEGDLGSQWGDSFREDRHKDLKADFVFANPRFNDSNWWGAELKNDARWRYGVPPENNANYAWIQHIISHLGPDGFAGVVLANGSMSSQSNNERFIRQEIIKADLIDCIVSLPGKLFHNNNQVPACLWILARNKAGREHRKRNGELLFIDARKLGRVVDRIQRVFDDEDIARIAETYHAWRGAKRATEYVDLPGFSRRVTIQEVASHDFVLTPGRYVGSIEQETEDDSFDEKMSRLVAKLASERKVAQRLDQQISDALRSTGYVL